MEREKLDEIKENIEDLIEWIDKLGYVPTVAEWRYNYLEDLLKELLKSKLEG